MSTHINTGSVNPPINKPVNPPVNAPILPPLNGYDNNGYTLNNTFQRPF